MQRIVLTQPLILPHTATGHRSDPQYIVRNEALHVWKTVVVNTPKTLLQILPVLMGQVIAALASDSEDRQVRCGV